MMGPTILFCGDCHGRFERLAPAASEVRARGGEVAGLILLGDVIDRARVPFADTLAELEASCGAPIWFIHGNHEVDDETNWRMLASAADRNIPGRIIELGGLRIAGLGGVFRGEIWHPRQSPVRRHANYEAFEASLHLRQGIAGRLAKHALQGRQGIPPAVAALTDRVRNGTLRRHLASIFPDDVDHLAAQDADILVTHEAPGGGLHPYGFDELVDLAQTMPVRWSFHGHQHDCLDAHYATQSGRVGFAAHGVGLRGVSALSVSACQVATVAPGELDATRHARVMP